MLRLGIAPGKLYRATFICQDGLCCCNMALISFRLFRKNLGNLRDFFGQMIYRPPWQKISRTPMQIIEQYWSYGSIKELYNLQRVLERKSCRDLIIIPVDLAILEEMAFIWACHDRFWWMITPKNFVCSTLLILFLSMLIERPSRFIFFLAGWNKKEIELAANRNVSTSRKFKRLRHVKAWVSL